jgi:hypothetical protein
MRNSARITAKGQVFVTGQGSDANSCKFHRSLPEEDPVLALAGSGCGD